jgi:hypothetical protein
METEVLNPPANGLDGRQKGVSSITMSDALVLFTIFLGGEVEVDAHGGVEGVGSDGGTIDGDRPGDFKGRVTEAEGGQTGHCMHARLGEASRSSQ